MKTQSTLGLDEAIRQAYTEIRIGADKLVANSQNRAKLAKRVRELTAVPAMSEDEICDRMISLRKRGADNGGLPRLERAFNGRNQSRPNKPR